MAACIQPDTQVVFIFFMLRREPLCNGGLEWEGRGPKLYAHVIPDYSDDSDVLVWHEAGDFDLPPPLRLGTSKTCGCCGRAIFPTMRAPKNA